MVKIQKSENGMVDTVKVYSTYRLGDYIHPSDYDEFYPNELGDVIFTEDDQETA